jgi:signal transduction protein with GAF and PtsI domain
MRLIELASHDGPLEPTLTAMCDELAAIADVDIASVYVREDDRLVMRGNHGFAPTAIGATTLAVGEGITGLVAECMRPVSAARRRRGRLQARSRSRERSVSRCSPASR